jgi:hypothetical protein
LIENSIKIIDNYLLLIKLVIDDQEKSMKTRFHRQSLINNRLKKLNTATLKKKKFILQMYTQVNHAGKLHHGSVK